MNSASSEHNWYKILGVDEHADQALVSKVFQFRSRQLHPDAGGDPEQMKLVNQAWDVLRDPGRRAAFDAQRASERQQAEPSPEPERPVDHRQTSVAQDTPRHSPSQFQPEVVVLPPSRGSVVLGTSVLARASGGLWLAVTVGVMLWYSKGGETSGLSVLAIGLVISLVAAAVRISGGARSATLGFAGLCALATWMFWSGETLEGLVLSWLMIVWTIFYVVAVETRTQPQAR